MNNWQTARNEIAELRKKEWFVEFLEFAKGFCKTSNSGLDQILTVPLNRTAQYQYELEQLKKATPPSHNDYRYIIEAITEFEQLKEATGESRAKSIIEKIMNELTAYPVKLFFPFYF